MALMVPEAFEFQHWSRSAEPIMAKAPCPLALAQPKNHVAKTNPMVRDANQKVIKELRWIEGCYNSSWVKERGQLEKTEESSGAMQEAQEEEEEEEEEEMNMNGDREVLTLVKEEIPALEQVMAPQLSIENLAGLLHKCTKERNLVHALHLHAYMCKSGLEAHRSLGNSLVSMLVEVGRMRDAQRVFGRLAYRNEGSWDSLINGYIKCGDPRRALILYQALRRQDDSVHPREYTVVALLKACTQLKDLELGREIHAEIARKRELEADIFIGSTLVHMYAKCGLLAKAQELFDKLPAQDTVSWNALITGYAEHGHGEQALNSFEQMQVEGISPNAITFVCILKACGSIAATNKGQEIHAEITKKGLERDLFVGNTLVDMYAKCGLLAQAQDVFDKLQVQDTVSWNALIAGYAEHGHGEKALNCFKQMQVVGVFPNAVTFVCSLKACGSIGATDKGQEIHAMAARKGLERDLFVGNTLVDMYAKFGLLAKAQDVFDKLPVRDTVSWNALIAGYAEDGCGEDALKCFDQMQVEGVTPNAVTFVCSLNACGSIGATEKGQEIHAEIAKKGLEGNPFVGNTLVDMYAKCGLLAKAQEVFDKLPLRDTVSWSALIAGYAEHGCGEQALDGFEQMQLEGISPDVVTFASSLKACGSIGATDKGREIHAMISRKGLEGDLFVGNTLIDMYAKCGLLAKAQEVFDKLPVRDAISWNALITGYAEHGQGEEALNCFEQMQLESISPDVVTFACSLKACGSIGATVKGQEIHAMIARKGLERNLVVGSSLVDMYAKCGLLEKAQEVFAKLLVRDRVLWNSLMAGYAEEGRGEEALNCLEQMLLEGISPDVVSFACILKACGSIGAIDKGQEIHAIIEREGLEGNLVVGSTLVDMYAKCGSLAKAHELFDKLPVRDTVSWNALIAGYAQLGETENVFHIFERMTGEGENPDLVTFLNVLNACSHAGLVEKGQTCFEAMSKDYGIIPALEHHTCMVDLLGRAGQLDKAVAMIKTMPFDPDLVVWHTMLGACQKWGNVELGRRAFDHAVQLGEMDAAAYVCMRNIY